MKPINYTKIGDKITYHYTFKQLREFLTQGFKEGNNGLILVGQDKRFLKYKGFGTIENPWKYVAKIEMQNDPIMDGEMPDPEKIINPPEPTYPYTSWRMDILDLGEVKDVKFPILGRVYDDTCECITDYSEEEWDNNECSRCGGIIEY